MLDISELELPDYNPEQGDDGTVTDPRTNLDEFACVCAREADACESGAAVWLNPAGRSILTNGARNYRIRQIALLAAFYIENELRESDGKHDAVKRVLAYLESRTCPANCNELRDLLRAT